MQFTLSIEDEENPPSSVDRSTYSQSRPSFAPSKGSATELHTFSANNPMGRRSVVSTSSSSRLPLSRTSSVREPSPKPLFDRGLAARRKLARESPAFREGLLASAPRSFYDDASRGGGQAAPGAPPLSSSSEASPSPPATSYASSVSFLWVEFFFSLVAELLPIHVVAPVFVCMVKGFRKGWNVAKHRALIPMVCCGARSGGSLLRDSRFVLGTSWSAILQWFTWLSFLLFWMYRPKMEKDGIDFGELAVLCAPPVMRALVIATKYAYYTEEELRDMESGSWSPAKSGRKMLLAGWCYMPRAFPDLLKQQIDVGMKAAEIDLNKVYFRVQRDVGVEPNAPVEFREVSAMAVLSRIIYSKFSPMVTNFRRVFIGQTICALTPAVTRLIRGTSVIGTSWQSSVFLIVSVTSNIVMGSVVYLFLSAAAHDFSRRRKAAKLLSSVMSYPGVPLVDFLQDDEADKDDKPISSDTLKHHNQNLDDVEDSAAPTLQGFADHVSFDLRDPSNAHAYLLTRQVLRRTGSSYYERCQIFVGFYFFVTLLFLLVINFQYWTSMPHSVFGVIQMFIYLLWIMIGFCRAAHEAIKLQRLVGRNRIHIKKELVLIEKEICDVRNELASPTMASKSDSDIERKGLQIHYENLNQSKTYLKTGDDFIAYEEEVFEPRQVLWRNADNSVLSYTIGIVASGLFLAYQGYNASEGGYDGKTGWYYHQ